VRRSVARYPGLRFSEMGGIRQGRVVARPAASARRRRCAFGSVVRRARTSRTNTVDTHKQIGQHLDKRRALHRDRPGDRVRRGSRGAPCSPMPPSSPRRLSTRRTTSVPCPPSPPNAPMTRRCGFSEVCVDKIAADSSSTKTRNEWLHLLRNMCNNRLHIRRRFQCGTNRNRADQRRLQAAAQLRARQHDRPRHRT
jgi:hypothetical protein